MAFHIQKTSAVDSSVTVYYVNNSHWSDDYSERKTWETNTTPTNMMVNSDGKNGGWTGASIVEE
jgi:hypothetical protein